jgi:hypothetical protein
VRPGVRAGAALLLTLGVVSACRFERRTDLVADEPVAVALYLAPDHPTTPLEDSVRAAVIGLTDALGAADSARVVALTTPEAILVDLEEGARWTRAGGSLPRPLSADETLAWQIEGISFDPLADGGALYSCLFGATTAAGAAWSAVESWVVVRTDAGWRVRYLHRSREPGRSTPLP